MGSSHDDVDEVLAHFGVKGMHWGSRKASVDVVSRTTGHRTTVKFNPRKAKVDVGPDGKPGISTNSRHELRRIQKQIDRHPSDDAANAAKAKAKLKKGGVKALSNKELQDIVTRINLEKQYSTLNPSKLKAAGSVVKGVLATGRTVNDAISFANSPAGKIIKTQLAGKLGK